MKEKIITTGNGAGFFDLLQLMFIGLKLTGLIEWSWVFVLVPFTAFTSLAFATIVFEDLADAVIDLTFDKPLERVAGGIFSVALLGSFVAPFAIISLIIHILMS